MKMPKMMKGMLLHSFVVSTILTAFFGIASPDEVYKIWAILFFVCCVGYVLLSEIKRRRKNENT